MTTITNEVEKVKITDLIPYEGNPMDHSKSLKELVDSIKEHGFYGAMLIDQNNRIICGHNRRNAAIEAGLDEVPCLRKHIETNQEYIHIMTSDNKIAALSKYDNEALKAAFDILDAKNRKVIGFPAKEIDKLFGIIRDTDGNEVSDFGDAGKVTVEREEAIKKKTFTFTESQHEDITSKLKFYIKEHDLENEAHALIMLMKGIQRAPKTIVKAGPVKVVSPEEDE